MNNFREHTICALATAAGGPVAIIRISGGDALPVAMRFWQGRSTPASDANHRRLLLGTFRNAAGDILDQQCLLAYMPGPASYTGEDVVEFHIHGGAVSCRLILNELLAAPEIQLAEAGEFTRRAFINGRIDLTQAEAVADLLGAGSEAAMNLANRQLAGALGTIVNTMYDELREILAESESHLDFPEEELEWQPAENMSGALAEMRERLNALIATRREGEVLRDGVTLAIAGAPNAGKSSLLNRLLGRERAIVSPIPGTTRDTVEAELVLRGIPLHLVDTAGIREADDTIEANGIQRARNACADADIVLWITDATAPVLWPGWQLRGSLICAANKCDIADAPPEHIAISALTGAGMQELGDAIENAALGRQNSSFSAIAVNARHSALMEETAAQLNAAIPLLNAGEWELAAVPMRNAMEALGKITGRSIAPDILDNIFHRFCIGK